MIAKIKIIITDWEVTQRNVKIQKNDKVLKILGGKGIVDTQT